MHRLTAFLSHVLRNEWREIKSAPFDREIDVAIIAENISVFGGPCLRHGDVWLDAETLMPMAIAATHWRYRSAMLPTTCC